MTVRFGPFTFDAASGELWREGRRVALQRQPARLLELLVTRRGEVVSRAQIRDALWGNDVHVDFERSLNFCVGKLRAALGDDAAAPRFVETVPTRGYRFIAAAEHAEKQAAEHAALAGNQAAEYADKHSDGLRWAIAIALLFAIGAGFVLGYYEHTGPALPKIVVIPFHNETGSPDFDRAAKGVSDAAVARLAAPDHSTRLRVIGNATDVFFSFKPHDMKAIGEKLAAQYLLLGQVKKDERRARVIAHLIRVSDQTHVWAKTFDRDSLDLAEQSAIAEEIAKAVSAHM